MRAAFLRKAEVREMRATSHVTDRLLGCTSFTTTHEVPAAVLALMVLAVSTAATAGVAVQ